MEMAWNIELFFGVSLRMRFQTEQLVSELCLIIQVKSYLSHLIINALWKFICSLVLHIDK